MATKKALAERIFKITKRSSQSFTNCRISTSSCSVQTRVPRNPTQSIIDPDPGDRAVFDGLRPTFLNSSEIRSKFIGESLTEKLKAIDIAKDRIRLEGLSPPPSLVGGLTMEESRRLLLLAQLETAKSKLSTMEKLWISYPEFVRICGEGYSDPEQGTRVAKTLDESGFVIVLGNSVFLNPEQVVKAIWGLIPVPASNPNDPRGKELEELEKQKAEIDKMANALVHRELWCGLGFFVVQTLGFMRLTFWELSWDVMEPICFYVTSIYCMAAYGFFLRTSKEPTFEGFYHSRFIAKQKRLMKLHNFNLERFKELQKICCPSLAKSPGIPVSARAGKI